MGPAFLYSFFFVVVVVVIYFTVIKLPLRNILQSSLMNVGQINNNV